MLPKILKTEEEFTEECPCAYQILSFVDSIKDTDARWFFDECYCHDDGRYTALFSSYITDEYKDYRLSIGAEPIDKIEWSLRIVKRVDNLLGEIGSK